VGENDDAAKNALLELDEPGAPEAPADKEASGLLARPTVRPAFDLETEIRDRMPTITDETALEQARLLSLPSTAPPARRPMSTVPGPIEMKNMRDSAAEIDAGEADVEGLDPADQLAILEGRLEPLTRVPMLAKELNELGTLLEDPKTAYVLGFVDGILPLETIIEVTGLPELDTLRVLDRMIDQAVVVFRSRK
jgi:hypothetical protein